MRRRRPLSTRTVTLFLYATLVGVRVVRRQQYVDTVVYVLPFVVVVHFFGDDRDARHEAEGLCEIGELEPARDRIARRFVRPFGEAGEERVALGFVEFPDHLVSPAGQ